MPTLPNFDISEATTAGARWTLWVEDFETAMTGYNIMSNKRKKGSTSTLWRAAG